MLNKILSECEAESRIPQRTILKQKCAHFCYKMVHCGIWDRYIVGFVQEVYNNGGR